MATKIQDIKAVNWQLSNKLLGEVAEGIDDVRQCIQTILTTTRGSDPLRPLFGSDIWKFIDTPVDTAAPNIAAEILDALNKWEPRIRVKSLSYDIDGSRIDYTLRAELYESGEVTQVLFFIDRQTQIDPPTIGRAFSNGFDFGFS
jgi:uncharacterized protein